MKLGVELTSVPGHPLSLDQCYIILVLSVGGDAEDTKCGSQTTIVIESLYGQAFHVIKKGNGYLLDLKSFRVPEQTGNGIRYYSHLRMVIIRMKGFQLRQSSDEFYYLLKSVTRAPDGKMTPIFERLVCHRQQSMCHSIDGGMHLDTGISRMNVESVEAIEDSRRLGSRNQWRNGHNVKVAVFEP
jgi:hypothetical protein